MKFKVSFLKKCNHNLLYLVLACCFFNFNLNAQQPKKTSYCNPLNLDYTYMIYNAHKDISYRSGADPAVVKFKNEYYMFVTRSMGYWHSKDLLDWDFIYPEKWYFEGSNAPAAFNYKDSILYVTGNPSGSMSLLYTDNPKKGDWKAVPSILNNLQDPAFFIDDDDQAYIFWGSSNKFPIRGRKLDKNKRFRPDEKVVELFNLEPLKHGWERFGENHSDTILGGYMEGPWLTKHNKKYYLQYAAPGTEFNVYGDGVYVSDNPLGPYEYAPNNPISYKPGGYMNGAGHGSTVDGFDSTFWHFATMALSVNVNWERRIAMFPTFFDAEGLLYSNTYFGDYPHYAPEITEKKGAFRGWMLLSYNKPVTASSFQLNNLPKSVNDENSKTIWLAEKNDATQWLTIDLEKESSVYAIQINFADYKSDLYGKIPDLSHQYKIEGSSDGKTWFIIVDKFENKKDVPNDYIEFEAPIKTRYIRYKNKKVPSPNLAISGLRVFGLGNGKLPKKAKNVHVVRHADKRDATITWDQQKNVQGYHVLWGIAPDKLYSSWLLYDSNELNIKSLNINSTYYFSVEAFNENGVSERTNPIKIE